MAGVRIGYSDECPSSKAKDVRDTAMLNTEAREKFATGENSTKPYRPKGTFTSARGDKPKKGGK